MDIETEETEETGDEALQSGIIARWEVALWTTCPDCKKTVDLLDGSDILPPEPGSPDNDNLEVTCPKCKFEFFVRCE